MIGQQASLQLAYTALAQQFRAAHSPKKRKPSQLSARFSADQKQVREEEARTFFEQNKERVSGDFAKTKDSIISYLQQSELRIAELAFVEKLRAAASIQVFLTAPEKSPTTSAQ